MSNTIGPRKLHAPADLRKCGSDIAKRELRDARLAAGFTSQEAAAEALGVSADTIYRQESGKTKVDAGLVFALRELRMQQKKAVGQ